MTGSSAQEILDCNQNVFLFSHPGDMHVCTSPNQQITPTLIAAIICGKYCITLALVRQEIKLVTAFKQL